MKIAITGHRPNKLGNDYDLISPLIQSIEEEIVSIIISYEKRGQGDITFITGMALGIDTLFAKIAINYHFPFIAAVPFYGQERAWPQKSRDLYNLLLAKASDVVICSSIYSLGAYQVRNKWMVDNCDILIAVWDETPGGTANCVNYARSINKDIIYINPKQIVL